MNFKPAASLAIAHVQLGSANLQNSSLALSTSSLLNRCKYEIVFVFKQGKKTSPVSGSLPDTSTSNSCLQGNYWGYIHTHHWGNHWPMSIGCVFVQLKINSPCHPLQIRTSFYSKIRTQWTLLHMLLTFLFPPQDCSWVVLSNCGTLTLTLLASESHYHSPHSHPPSPPS